MERDIKQLTRQPFDVLVIGGGINGAAVAHLAVLNGLKTALLEKGDFAGGTSSKSTKLIHGGLRYLENLEFGLVHESLRERYIQLKSAPHLVHPLRFIIPVYKGDRRPLWMVRFGVWLYDFLSGKYALERHSVLTADEVSRRVPGIQREGLIGGVIYSDGQMDDARLCLENVLSAAANGACVANYVEARSVLKTDGKAVGVSAYDHLTDKHFEVRAKKIVSAVGPWANHFIRMENNEAPGDLRTTKGVHIVYRGSISRDAILIPSQSDQRIFFVIPFRGNSLIGTTDTDYAGDPDSADVKYEDIEYLINEAKRVLPHADLSQDNIISTFAGLRPLVREHGSPSKISRKHVIKESYTGIIYVLGGKYTTYRKIAEDVVARLTNKAPVNTREKFTVYGSGEIKDDPVDVARQYGMPLDTIRHLMSVYGSRYRDVIKIVERDPEMKKPLCACTPAVCAQVVYAVETEMARTEEDVAVRRLGLDFVDCPTENCRKAIKRLISEMALKR